MTDIPMLKYMVLSALIGFFVFCGSYSVLVWKKRRQSTASASGAGRLRVWAVTFIVMGALGIGVTFAMREAVRAGGMLGGDGLFAVRMSQGMRVVHEDLAKEGPVKEGEVLAHFTSPEVQGEIDEAVLQRNHLEQQKEILSLQPLTLDQQLLIQHENALSARRQLQTNLSLTLGNNQNVGVREMTNKIVVQQDVYFKIDNEMQNARGDLRQAIAKRDIARVQLNRERELARKWAITTNELNERQKEVGSLEAEVAKIESNISALERRRQVAKGRLEELEKLASDQGADVKDVMAAMRKDLKANEERCEELEQQLYTETKKSQMRRNAELAALDTKIKQAEALLASKRNKLEVRAPFSGQVVYRHPSPGAALNHGPIQVMCPPEGLLFHFRIDDSQVDALRSAGLVMVELEETSNSVEQRFPGKFLRATPLARDPGMSLVDLECHAPPETVAALADDKPIKARFSWRPPMMNMWPFPASLVLIGLGILGLVVARISEWKPTWNVISNNKEPIEDDEESIVTYTRTPIKEGDTVEARDTIPERPVLPVLPRERPYEPWEHPVGIRLREAIIRQDISAELLTAIETAIEHKHDAVIVPIREALRRAPTVPDNARRLLDKLNSSDSDDLAQMEQRQLAQRLTFLLYTIGIEIPSEARDSAAPFGRVDTRFAGR